MRTVSAATIMVGLALSGASAGSATAAGPGCVPAGTQVLASAGASAVYAQDGSAYGCRDGSSAAALKLGSAFCNPGDCGAVGTFRFAGRYVAFQQLLTGISGGESRVEVADLALGTIGRRFRVAPLHGHGPAWDAQVSRLVLRPNGAAAWIASIRTPAHPAERYEVRAARAAHARRLDFGAAIAPGSLRLHGSRLTWRHGHATRSAHL